jgi:hypothetical protein
MPGFISYDDIINEMTVNGKVADWSFFKVTPSVNATWVSTWRSVGHPGSGSNPPEPPGTTYVNASGSMFFTACSPDQRHLTTFTATSNGNVVIMLYDRLVAVGERSLSGSIGTRSIMTPALPRYTGTDAVGVEAWLEITTATSTTAPVVRLSSYTNSAGVSGRQGDAVTFPAAATNAQCFIRLPMQAGDTGIRSVEEISVDTVSSTGVCNVVLLKTLTHLPVVGNVGNDRDLILQQVALPRIFDGASLCTAFLIGGAAATTIWAHIRAVHG